MSSCNNNLKHTCSGKQKAICVFYEGDIPDFSKLKDEDCVVIEENIEDLYSLVKELRDKNNINILNNPCISFSSDKVEINQVVSKILEELCTIKSNQSNTDILNIDGWDLDTSCLEEECGVKIGNLQQLLKAILKKIC